MNHSLLWDSLDSWNIFTLSKGKFTKCPQFNTVLPFWIQKKLSHIFRLWFQVNAIIKQGTSLGIWHLLKLKYFMSGLTVHHNFNYSYVAIGCCLYMSLFKCSYFAKVPEDEFLDEIQTKVLRVFFLAIHSQLYSFAFEFIFLLTRATSYSFLFSYCTL